MTRSNSPSARWTKQHGFRQRSRNRDVLRRERGGKIVYRSWISAWFNCWRVNFKFSDNMQPYSCRWGSDYRDGETAQRHWHLGHGKKTE